jgi:predicted nucleic acid-binding protein
VTAVVDTDVLIDFLRGHDPARNLLRRELTAGPDVLASVMTRTELLAGARTGEEAALEDLFRALRWVAVDESIADRAGQLARAHRRGHAGIDAVDFVIAATAQEHDAELRTRNVRHFPMFPGLLPAY